MKEYFIGIVNEFMGTGQFYEDESGNIKERGFYNLEDALLEIDKFESTEDCWIEDNEGNMWDVNGNEI